MTERVTKTLAELTADDVMSVYNGKAGCCCCGCNGKHKTNPKFKELRGALRGYDVSDDECSIRSIVTTLAKVKKTPSENLEFGQIHILAENKGRWNILYLAPGVTVNQLP